MPYGIGAKTKAGWGKETAWGIGVACTELVPFLSEDLTEQIAVLLDEYHHGGATQKNYQPSSHTIGGKLTVEGVYDTIASDPIGIGALLATAVGGATWKVTQTKINFEPTTDLERYATLAFAKQISVWEIQGAKCKSFEISGSAQGKIQFSFDFVGRKLLRTGDAGIVNTSSTFSGLTPTSDPTLMAFDHLLVRFASLGAPLAASDQINVSEFTLTVDNMLTDPTFSSPKSGEDALYTLEPIRTGKRKVTLKLTIPRYESDAAFTAFKANTAKQCDLKFTSGTNQFNIFLPNLRVDEPTAPVTGPEPIQQTFTLVALDNQNGGVNGDMEFESGDVIVYEYGIETKNARTAAP